MMTLNLNVPKAKEQLSPRITVIGVGGAGGNAVNNMIQSNLEGVDFAVANTDSQALAQTLCERPIQLGRNITQGLGAGSRPDIGRAAAEEALDEILSQLDGSNMIFVTAGMGGGTGTGAAPVIARAAREAGILTVGVVTKPFHFEGVHRMRLAESGIAELQQYVDTLIIIPNQNLFRVANEKTTFADAFKMADDVLDSGVRGVTDLMVMPGLINLDFADIRAVMTEMGKAMMGTGEAEGENRSIDAAEAAISNPLLDDVSMKGARGVLINITGGADMTLFEVDEAANRIRDEVDPEANIIFGSTFVQSLEGRMRVSVVATGIDADAAETPRAVALSLVSSDASSAAAGEIAPQLAGAAARTPASAYDSRPPALDTEAEERVFAQSAVTARFESPMTETSHGDRTESLAPRLEGQGLFSSAASQPAIYHEPRDEVGEQPTPVDSFIAPQPLEPEARPPLVAEVHHRPSRMAENQPTSGPRDRSVRQTKASPGPGRKRAQGLFARVSDAARAFQGSAQSGGPTEPADQPAEEPAASVSLASTDTAPSAVETLRQPQLSGLDPAGRLGGGAAEEELLDIPAFLRRQAN
jgi:cell division protein FtsZ